MFHKMLFLTIVASILVGTALLIPGGTSQALVQEETPPEDSSCLNCHEDQYYLFDRGSWYCLRETKVGCPECHRGRPDTLIKEFAHVGLIANPLVNEAAVCQNCHPDDYRARVRTYASIAGISPTPHPYATYTPSVLISQPGESAGRMRLLRALPPGTWQVAGLSFLGFAFLSLLLFTCRCWNTDRSARSKDGKKIESDIYFVS